MFSLWLILINPLTPGDVISCHLVAAIAAGDAISRHSILYSCVLEYLGIRPEPNHPIVIGLTPKHVDFSFWNAKSLRTKCFAFFLFFIFCSVLFIKTYFWYIWIHWYYICFLMLQLLSKILFFISVKQFFVNYCQLDCLLNFDIVVKTVGDNCNQFMDASPFYRQLFFVRKKLARKLIFWLKAVYSIVIMQRDFLWIQWKKINIVKILNIYHIE